MDKGFVLFFIGGGVLKTIISSSNGAQILLISKIRPGQGQVFIVDVFVLEGNLLGGVFDGGF